MNSSMNSYQKYFSVGLLALATQAVFAQSAPTLGSAADFAALGGAGVTCTSPNPPLPAVTISGGDVGSGLIAHSSVTGFPGFTPEAQHTSPGADHCFLSGTVELGATLAMTDFGKAYTALATLPACTVGDTVHNLSGDLKGKILSPGIYCIAPVGLLTGTLTLNGPANGVWIFKAETSITPIGGSVVMTGGGSACNVYWQTGTAVSLNNTDFVGNVLAGSAITFTGNGSSLRGRALAKTNVTLTGANITACATGNVPHNPGNPGGNPFRKGGK